MKKIRSNFVKESLLDYENLTKTLQENTSSIVKDLLEETVRNEFKALLSEADENDFEEEEVDDTEDSEMTKDAEEVADDSTVEGDDMESELSSEDGEEETESVDDTEVAEVPEAEEGSEDEEWAEFDKYKVGNDEYDFSQAEDEEIVKVYKLLKDEDQVMVNVDKETNKVELKDNETGAEYLIDMGSSNDETLEDDIDAEGELENDFGMTNESMTFEIALNEYDSHVGYTDNYQKKDVMTNPGTSEPGKNVNDWDAGVPHGDSKPWSSIEHKSDDKPFNGADGKKVEECGMMGDDTITEEDDVELEEATNVGGFVQQNTTSKSHVPNSNGRKARNMSQDGVKKSGTPDPRYGASQTNESKMKAKVDAILKENKALKNALAQFKKVLSEAAVTNFNLGQVVKLVTENSTTRDEKKEIIARFGKEATTIEESKRLFNSISSELKKKNTLNINEDKQFTTNGSKMINETQIYQSKDLMTSLDLMHRICR